ncbi:hypothetical protein [Roseovarius sp. D0-M9]|uniref:hypothetical protein n=1 Tax=Roseovarius sp. D0-M9 TaxID=3127117 RepID=UPI00301006E0
MEALAREKYVPMVKALGAESVDMLRTGDLTFLVVTKSADAADGEAAQARIDEIRDQAAESSRVNSAVGPHQESGNYRGKKKQDDRSRPNGPFDAWLWSVQSEN